MNQRAQWNIRMAEAAKVAKPQKTDPSRQLILPASAYVDEYRRYAEKVARSGCGVVFMED